jgi:DNA (cytosine-5)-methyltransferase 1
VSIPVIDLFAGPGGLNEGFSRLGEESGRPVFKTIASFEMDESACETLTLRATFHRAKRAGLDLDPYYAFLRGVLDISSLRSTPGYAEAFLDASREVHQIELGPKTRAESDQLISTALINEGIQDESRPWVLIGGPPCQAYSLAGRSRRANDESFASDKKHFLYQEYLHIIDRFAPPLFVMENVKGLLSSTNAGYQMFDRIMSDLRQPRLGLDYDIHSLVVRKDASEYLPNDFVIHAEDYGIPQKRHRVILVGIRRDLAHKSDSLLLLEKSAQVTVRDAIADLPQLRSGISRSDDTDDDWLFLRAEMKERFPETSVIERLAVANLKRGSAFMPSEVVVDQSTVFGSWIADENLRGVLHHETRAHMVNDLKRYWFAASRAAASGFSPKLRDLPEELLPNHANALSDSRPFEDRFRVQVFGGPATTVVSHIAKDGHYYIHPDPMQMRSFTVREAARLQTFPDNYYFCGNRTSKFHQVGNAVPPLLANQIANSVSNFFS